MRVHLSLCPHPCNYKFHYWNGLVATYLADTLEERIESHCPAYPKAYQTNLPSLYLHLVYCLYCFGKLALKDGTLSRVQL